MIPKGESTTKVLSKETVNANVKVYGEITKGFFKPPFVDFTNTNVDVERFDKFKLQTWRNELPLDDETIDLDNDLGLERIHLNVSLMFSVDAGIMIYGSFTDNVVLHNVNGDYWESDILHFDDYGLQRLSGDFRITVDNPSSAGILYTTGEFLQTNKLPIYIFMTKAELFNGNSSMDIMNKNAFFIPILNDFSYDVLGGE